MFRKVLSLLIKSRFSKSYLFAIALIFIYSLFTINFGYDSNRNFGAYYLAFFFLLFLVSATYTGGISTTSADRDFLLTSAIPNRVLVPAFFISQALVSSLIFSSAGTASLMLVRYNDYSFTMGIIDVICMAILPISMSLIMASLSRTLRILVSILGGTWVISSFFGVSIGPLAFLEGHVTVSSMFLIVVTIVATAISFNAIREESLPFRLSAMSSSNKGFKRLFSFTGKSPERAVFQLHFKQVDFSSRTASMGNIKVKVNRVSVYTILLVSSIIATFFTIYEFYFNKNLSGSAFSSDYVLSIFPEAYAAWGISIGLSSGTLSKERAWLAFISMPAEKYIRITELAKIFQTMLVSVPFVIANIILFFRGFSESLTSIVIFLVLVPIYSGINFSLSFYRKAFQIKQEDVLPTTYNMSQFMLLPVTFMMLILIFIGMFFPLSLLFIISGSAIFLILFMGNANHWKRTLYKMIESGYI